MVLHFGALHLYSWALDPRLSVTSRHVRSSSSFRLQGFNGHTRVYAYGSETSGKSNSHSQYWSLSDQELVFIL